MEESSAIYFYSKFIRNLHWDDFDIISYKASGANNLTYL